MTNPKRKGILSGITRPSKPLTGGATKAALASALTKIRPGDRVAFKGQRGVVQQITERLIVVRHDLGYGFSVLAKELLQTPIEINGQRLQLTAIERKEEEPVELLTEAESATPEPDDWEWFGAELRARGAKDAFISISGKEIRISSAASVAAGFKRGQKVAVGIGKGGLALRRSDNGIPLVGRGAPQSSATQMGACSIIELLIARGWKVPCKLETEWDAKRGILIGYRNRKAVG